MVKRRLPPATPGKGGFIGPNVRSYEVGSWVPNQFNMGKPMAVAIAIKTEIHGDLVLRLKTPKAVDQMIQSLLRHKREVWPEAP